MAADVGGFHGGAGQHQPGGPALVGGGEHEHVGEVSADHELRGTGDGDRAVGGAGQGERARHEPHRAEGGACGERGEVRAVSRGVQDGRGECRRQEGAGGCRPAQFLDGDGEFDESVPGPAVLLRQVESEQSLSGEAAPVGGENLLVGVGRRVEDVLGDVPCREGAYGVAQVEVLLGESDGHGAPLRCVR